MIPNIGDWNITIIATDINPLFLKKASKGVYTKWSFRSTPEWAKLGYFKKIKDGHYQINPQLKKMVRFSYSLVRNCCGCIAGCSCVKLPSWKLTVSRMVKP